MEETHYQEPSTKFVGQPTEKLSLIIPFYNEKDSIPHLAQRLLPVVNSLRRRWQVQLILIDDGSTDNTYNLLVHLCSNPSVGEHLILRHMDNRGLGAALRTGFEAATGDYVCTMDSDCTYAPEDVALLVERLIQTGADIVTGSPYHPEGDARSIPAWRLFISKSASRIYSLIVPTRLHCYTSIFRVFRKDWARPEFVADDGFLGVTEALVNSSLQGAKIVELPVTLNSRGYGHSKMRIAEVTLKHLGLMKRTWIAARSAAPAMPAPVEIEPVLEVSPLLNRWVLVARVGAK